MRVLGESSKGVSIGGLSWGRICRLIFESESPRERILKISIPRLYAGEEEHIQGRRVRRGGLKIINFYKLLKKGKKDVELVLPEV